MSSYVTRSGRVSKPPERYEPVEEVTDDYDEGEYDGDESDSEEEDYSEDESEDESLEDEDSDADEHGNLKDFIDYEDSDEEEAA